MIEISTSKFQLGVTGEDNCFKKGDKAISKDPAGIRRHVIINSDMYYSDRHGWVYDCLMGEKVVYLPQKTVLADSLTPDLSEHDYYVNPRLEWLMGVRHPQIYMTSPCSEEAGYSYNEHTEIYTETARSCKSRDVQETEGAENGKEESK